METFDIFDSSGKLPSLETCKLLDWQKPTEKSWYKLPNGTFEALPNKYILPFDGWLEICTAPDFAEIWKELPKRIDSIQNGYYDDGSIRFTYIELDFKNYPKYSICYKSDSFYDDYMCNGLIADISDNLAQSAAELYIKLRNKNILVK